MGEIAKGNKQAQENRGRAASPSVLMLPSPGCSLVSLLDRKYHEEYQ